MTTYLDNTSGQTELDAAKWLAREQRLINHVSLKSLDTQLRKMVEAGLATTARYWELKREHDKLKNRYRVDRRAYRRLMKAV